MFESRHPDHISCGYFAIPQIAENLRGHTGGTRSSRLTRRSWTVVRREAELAKCQVLCLPCHHEKSRQDKWGERKHGTAGMYRNAKCRCAECREWSTQSRYDWMRRNGLRAPESVAPASL